MSAPHLRAPILPPPEPRRRHRRSFFLRFLGFSFAVGVVLFLAGSAINSIQNCPHLKASAWTAAMLTSRASWGLARMLGTNWLFFIFPARVSSRWIDQMLVAP